MKRILILSQGRSGSTLVQRVLNTLPSSYIAGENKNLWYYQFKSYESWCYIPVWEEQIADRANEQYFSYQSVTDAYKPCWWNRDYENKREEVLKSSRSLFSKLYQQNANIVGFKEIRFPIEETEFNEYLDWWRLLFPDIYFIFTVRDINTVTRSGWWKPKDKPLLQTQERLLRSRKDAFLLEYENFDWQGLFNYIDEPYNEIEVKRILDKKL